MVASWNGFTEARTEARKTSWNGFTEARTEARKTCLRAPFAIEDVTVIIGKIMSSTMAGWLW